MPGEGVGDVSGSWHVEIANAIEGVWIKMEGYKSAEAGQEVALNMKSCLLDAERLNRQK
jgi:hypothetical protein